MSEMAWVEVHPALIAAGMKTMVVWAALPSDLADCCLRDLAAVGATAALSALCAAAAVSGSALALVSLLEVDEEVSVVAVG